MTAEFGLGVRLARRAGWSRMAALVCFSAAGVAVLLFCADFPDAAHIVRAQDPRDDRILLRCLTFAIALPVVYLIGAVVRLSSDARERRIALLRLMGVAPRRLGVVVMAEVGLLTLFGGLIGVIAHVALRQPVGTAWVDAGFTQRVSPSHVGQDVVVALLVAVCAAALAARPVVRTAAQSVTSSRRGRRPALQRAGAVLALVGFASSLFAVFGPKRHGYVDPNSILYVGIGMMCLGLGLASLTQTLLALIARLLRRRAGAASTVMAARLEADRVAFGRALGGLVLSTFVVATGLCVFTAWKSTPQYVSTEWAVHHETSVLATTTGDRTIEAAAQRVRQADGVSRVEPVFQWTPAGDPTQVGMGAVSVSCAQIARFADVEGCSDTQPWVVAGPSGEGDAVKPFTVVQGSRRLRVTPGTSRAVNVHGPTNGWGLPYLQYGTIVIPPKLLAGAGIQPNALLVTLAPGVRDGDFITVDDIGFSGGGDWENYATVNRLGVFVFILSGVVLLIGAITVVVATLDLVAARRRRVAALQVLGFPAGLLRRAQWGAMTIPVVVGIVLAVAAGMLCGLGYLRYGGYPEMMPWSELWGLLGLGLVAGLALAVATGVGMGRPLTADMLRRE